MAQDWLLLRENIGCICISQTPVFNETAKMTSQGASGPMVWRFSQCPIRLPALPLTHPALSRSDMEAGPNTTYLCFHWHWPLNSTGLSSALICNTRPFCKTDLRLQGVWIYRVLSLMWCTADSPHWERQGFLQLRGKLYQRKRKVVTVSIS